MRVSDASRVISRSIHTTKPGETVKCENLLVKLVLLLRGFEFSGLW